MRVAVFLFCACVCASCGDNNPTTPSSTTAARATERFDDIISVRESKFYPFSVGASGTTSINLASLSPIDRPGALAGTMEIGWGKVVKDESGTVVGCQLAKVMQTSPALTAQMNEQLPPAADYCANIADVGALREPVNFSMRIFHP